MKIKVKCDETNNSEEDRKAGRINVEYEIEPMKIYFYGYEIKKFWIPWSITIRLFKKFLHPRYIEIKIGNQFYLIPLIEFSFEYGPHFMFLYFSIDIWWKR